MPSACRFFLLFVQVPFFRTAFSAHAYRFLWRGAGLCLLFFLTFSARVYGQLDTSALERSRAFLAAVPLAFEENKGQVQGEDAHRVRFRVSAPGIQVFILNNGIAYQYGQTHFPEGHTPDFAAREPGEREMRDVSLQRETYRMDVLLLGARADAEIVKEGRSTDAIHYYNHDVLGVHSYEKIIYRDIYPGIDWQLFFRDGKLEHEFVVHPGADPELIRIRYEHHEGLELNPDGSLTMKSRMGNITDHAPLSFQGERVIGTQYSLEGNELRFRLSEYDRTQALLIDPVVSWATYYGDAGDDYGQSCATDGQGNVYLGGYTLSDNGIASGGHQLTRGEYGDAFLVKFNASGQRQWATYYGGAGVDDGYSCATDGQGNVYLGGYTQSDNGIASGGHQLTRGGFADAFLVKFNASGQRQWATYYGGAGFDYGQSCATDGQGNVYLSGYTQSDNGIASGGHQSARGGNRDAFLVKFNASGQRQWATYYGGAEANYGLSCATDGQGNVYLSGYTQSDNGIASGGHQLTRGGDLDAFLVKFNASGQRQWATYYGGAEDDYGGSCATDGQGNVYLSGYTRSDNGIASGGHQSARGGNRDAFLVKFNASGQRQWATYYGGAGADYGLSCATDGQGNVYLGGYTQSDNGIASGGHQSARGGNFDAFLVKFNASGQRQWATYYGGAGNDNGYSCATDGQGNVYLGGYTQSDNGIASGGHQLTWGGNRDAFLVKFSEPSCYPQPTVYVDSAATGANDGSSWANAYTSLSEALNLAHNCLLVDTILVAKGTYYPTGARSGTNRDSAFAFYRGSLYVLGGYPTGGGTRDWNANPTVLSGDIGVPGNSSDNSHHIIVITGVTTNSLLIDGFHITGANANVESSYPYNGRSINRRNGGGISMAHNGGNTDITISNCRIYGNKARFGGGILCHTFSSPQVVNCLIYHNTATTDGGGMYNTETSLPRITLSTLTGNTATGSGGAIFNGNASNPLVSNTIVWDNNSAIVNSATVSYSIIQGGHSGTGNLNTDPFFANPDVYDYRLLPCSPAIDAGHNDSIPSGITRDLDGNPRIYGGTVDMGAYEQQGIGNVTLYVDASATGANDGSSWANAYTSLAFAIKQAHECSAVDKILVAEGTYYPEYIPPTTSTNTTQRDRSFYFLRDGLAVLGGYPRGGGARDWSAHRVVLSGDIGVSGSNVDNAYHVVLTVGAGAALSHSLVLDGLHITRGNASGSGSVLVNGATVQRGYGGGMYNQNSSPLVTNSVFSGNNTNNSGGGMINNNSSPLLTQTVFSGNSASNGGGMYNQNSSPIVIHSVFSGNSANNGGGIYNNVSSPVVTNSIIWGNSQGIYNNIFTNNPKVSYSIVQGGYTGAGNLNTNPLFVQAPSHSTAPFTTGDYRLLPCSPAIDAGHNDSIPSGITRDLDGNPRIYGGTVDMGAYEQQGTGNVTLYVDASATGANNGSSWANAYTSLAFAIKQAHECSAVDAILVAQGTYYPTGARSGTNRDSAFAFYRGNLNVLGGYPTGGGIRDWNANPTVLSGDIGVPGNSSDNSYHVVVTAGASADSTLIIDGFYITEGRGVGGGGNYTMGGHSVSRERGAGMANVGSSPVVRHMVFTENIGYAGAAVGNTNASPRFENLLVHHNTGDYGAGFYNNASSPRIVNVTIAHNVSATTNNSGVGMRNLNAYPHLQNSIIWGNRSANGTLNQIFNSGGATPTSVPVYSYSIVQGSAAGWTGLGSDGGHNKDADPFFVDAAAKDFRLQPCSPALDAGNNSLLSSAALTDLDGNPRIYGGTVDMGTYELQDTAFNQIDASIVTTLPLCYNGNAEVQINHSKAQVTYRLIDGANPVGMALQGNGATLSLHTANLTAGTSDYQVQATLPACSITVALPAITVDALPSALAQHGDSRTCYLNGNQDYVVFTGANGAVLAVNPRGENLGYVTAQQFVEPAAPLVEDCDNSSSSAAALRRHWTLQSQHAPAGTVEVSAYLYAQDLSDLVAVAAASPNAADNVNGITELDLHRYSGANENGNFPDNCGNGIVTVHPQSGTGTIAGISDGLWVSAAVPGFSELWLAGSGLNSPLPVSLLSFEATCAAGQAALRWATASESNNAYYTVERSRDFSTWETVATIPGAGYSNQVREYSLYDPKAEQGTVYYRLTQTDHNGASETFGPIQVTCDETESRNLLRLYPNPTRTHFILQLHSTKSIDAQVDLYDMYGQQVATYPVTLHEGINELRQPLHALPAGTYIVHLKTEGMEFLPVRLTVY